MAFPGSFSCSSACISFWICEQPFILLFCVRAALTDLLWSFFRLLYAHPSLISQSSEDLLPLHVSHSDQPFMFLFPAPPRAAASCFAILAHMLFFCARTTPTGLLQSFFGSSRCVHLWFAISLQICFLCMRATPSGFFLSFYIWFCNSA